MVNNLHGKRKRHIFSPLFFLMLINDLSENLVSERILFVDDKTYDTSFHQNFQKIQYNSELLITRAIKGTSDI